METSAGNRDEWRYYSEGRVVRSVGHAQLDFMRIDFYDDIVLRSPNGAHDQVDATRRRTGRSSRGIFRRKVAFIDNRRSTSHIVGHHITIAGFTDIGRTLTEGDWSDLKKDVPGDLGGAKWRIAREPWVQTVLPAHRRPRRRIALFRAAKCKNPRLFGRGFLA
ncbi:hypothetical protein [Burkholderia sp. Bp9143]|uniref:hypothetical protein n=1 Tax=Burkholderia sp. Bp9143 TaxID=2184574 RepID=UPI000F59AE92|nr:hypothetical protein [Burkholderia sp. Bp9143]